MGEISNESYCFVSIFQIGIEDNFQKSLMIANTAGRDKSVTAAVLAFMLVGMIVAAPYQMWLKRRAGAPGPASQGVGASGPAPLLSGNVCNRACDASTSCRRLSR